jgi:hypothetical protein
MHHPGQRDVVGPPGGAGDEPLVLLAQPAAPDLGLVEGRGHPATPVGLGACAGSVWVGTAAVPAVASAADCTARTMFS